MPELNCKIKKQMPGTWEREATKVKALQAKHPFLCDAERGRRCRTRRLPVTTLTSTRSVVWPKVSLSSTDVYELKGLSTPPPAFTEAETRGAPKELGNSPMIVHV